MRHAPRAPTALCALVAAGLRGGGDVAAPPIGQPSERSQRSKAASDPRTLLAPPPIPAATPAASSALQRAEKRRGGTRPAMHDEGSAGRASAGPVAPSAHDCRRPDDRRRAAADGGAVGAAAAAPPVGGALVVAWAALRRRSGRPGSGGSLPPHHFEMPADHFEMPARRPAGSALLFSTKQNSSQLRKLKRAGWKH